VQLLGDRLADRGLLAGQQSLVALHDGHHGAEHGEQHAELTGHRTAADHHHRVRQVIAGQRLRTGPRSDRLQPVDRRQDGCRTGVQHQLAIADPDLADVEHPGPNDPTVPAEQVDAEMAQPFGEGPSSPLCTARLRRCTACRQASAGSAAPR
jgi:hypothetical protein